MFTKAQRTEAYIKLALTGPSGSGKTFSSLRLARGLVGPNGKIAFVDTENRSATLYSDLTEFFHLDLTPPFAYKKFIEAIKEAEKAGFDCIILDSASHLWQGILEEKTNLDRKGGNQYTNWADPTKNFNSVIQSLVQSRIHVISCMRTKTDYVLQLETNSKGKDVQTPKKVGLAPIMRDGIEYEFTTVFEVGMDHQCSTSKDRTGLFVDQTFLITEETGELIQKWIAGASPVSETEIANEFLKQLTDATSKETLNEIGIRIKASALSESQKDSLRKVYLERSNTVV